MSSEEEKKEVLTENHDADSNSNSSDAASNNGNKNKLVKKKTLSDMLKKLHPDQVNGLESADIPTFLKKDSPKNVDSDQQIPPNEPTNQTEPKLSPSLSSTSTTQTKVSRPKLNADVYKCAVENCSKSFVHVNDFKQHITNQHSDIDPLPCCFCFSSFAPDSYFDHLSCHIKNLMKCLYCQVSHDTREELLRHLSEKHPNQPKKINVCIRILNNVRGKKSHSDTHHESKSSGKSSLKPNSETGKKLAQGILSSAETPKSRNRKASKPTKSLNQIEGSDKVEIKYVKNALPLSCELCSFACNTDIHLKQHIQDGHENPSSCTLFRCKICKMNSDDKEGFETHMAHHLGKHTIRYYTCPYCSTISNNMETIENHIAGSHVDKAFRFEVLQENIDYIQDLVICPVCNGAYRWQKNFIQHLESVHVLKDLADYFTLNYPDKKLPSQLQAFRSYFKNLLPDAPDYDYETSSKLFLPSADNDELGGENKEEAHEKAREKRESKTSEHPLLYDMLSKKPTDSPNHSLIIIQPSSSPPACSSPSPDSLQYLDRYPPADLAQFVIKKGSRMTFTCNLCPFECTKTTHFRRHMDIHKRNESLSDGYKCGYCQFAHPRLNCIRFHLGKYHSDLPYMMTRIVDNSYINMGPEDDPTLKKSKAKVPFVTSTPIVSGQRPERERRAPIKMESDFDWNPGKSPGRSVAGPGGSHINCDHMSLSEFEQYLPTIMIFPDVYKCPKCNFANRVRVNLLNHLKLHKAQEVNQIHDSTNNADRERSDLDNTEESSANGDDDFKDDDDDDNNDDAGKQNPKLSNLNPLFDYLSDKKSGADFLEDAEEVTFVTRANLTDEYKHFSFKVPNTNHYQCKECNFIHRYPSKVKRHYYYKHAPAFPYKCGYCTFGAVEGGKVKRHCKVVHPNKREMVVKRNVYKKNITVSDANRGSSSNNNNNNNNNTSNVKSLNTSLNKVLPHRKQDDDDCETEQDSVKIKKQYVYKCSEDDNSSDNNSSDNNDLWLPQFVTLLDDDIQCCKLCGYQQDGSSSLREHVLTAHLEFYPYSCAHCGFALMDLSRVRKHIDVHHPGLNYSAFHRCIIDNENNDTNHSVRDNGENEFSDENDSQNSQMVIDESSQLDHESIEFNDDDIDESTIDKQSSMDEGDSEMVAAPSVPKITKPLVISDSFNGKRQFKCYYCGVISKWNRRDIRLHVLHVHLRKKVYTCRHCGFGNSKSKAIVKTHCMKFHPNKNISVKDELALFNAIVPIEDANGIVTMVLCNKNGEPILELSEDGNAASRNESKVAKLPLATTLLKVIKLDSKPPSMKTSGSECHWKCKQCSYASSMEIDVKYHLLSSHLNIRPYSCPHCHVYLSRAELVLSHIEKYHPDEKKEVRDTLEEKDVYLQKNIEFIGYKKATSSSFHGLNNEDEDEIDEDFAKVMERQKNPRYSSGYFRCLLCGYRDPRNDKTKYHIIKTHLNLRQFSCPHCNQYMWGRQQVVSHIEEEHPGKEVYVKRTFHEYDQFLRKNIKKFSFPKSGGQEESLKDVIKTSRAIPRIQCDSCSFVTDSELSLAAHKRTHKIFQCFYCDFKHIQAARVQNHCLEKHPSNPVQFKNVDSFNFESARKVEEEDEDDDRNLTGNNIIKKECNEAGLDDIEADDTDMDQQQDASCEEEFEHFGDDDNNNKDLEDDEDDDDDDGENNNRCGTSAGANTFVCQICQSVRWTKSDILIHSNEMHPDKVPSFIAVKTEGFEKKSKINREVFNRHEDDFSDRDDCTNNDSQLDGEDDYEISNIKMNNVAHTKFSNMSTTQLLRSKDSLYQCRLCTYKSNKMTVMRHHIMSHLRYHPYVCPYCNLAKSVKSFPIKKHVAAKHPGKDVIAMHCVDDEQERIIAKSYYKFKVSNRFDEVPSVKATKTTSKRLEYIANYANNDDDDDIDGIVGGVSGRGDDNDGNGSDGVDNFANIDNINSNNNINNKGKIRNDLEANKNILPSKEPETSFKCKFCEYTTTVQSEMKHHLMKELNYKPYKCNLCSFRDAQKPVITKHYQKQHLTSLSSSSPSSSPSKSNVGELKIKEEMNAEKEELIKKLLEECRCSKQINNSSTNRNNNNSSSNQQQGYAKQQQKQQPHHQQHPQQQQQQRAHQLQQIHPAKPAEKKQPIVIQNNNKMSMILLKPDSKLYKCPECTYTNVSLKLVRGHMVKHGPHRLKCAYCDYKAHYPSRIRKHTRRQHSDQVFTYTNISYESNHCNGSVSSGNNNNNNSAVPVLVVQPGNNNNNNDEDDDDEEYNNAHVAGTASKMPIGFPIIAHSDGWFRCECCDYSTMNRDHYRAHLFTHKPRRWKCFYCDQRYPIPFRVKRHCTQKHPKMRLKWVDIETGNVHTDNKSQSSTTTTITTIASSIITSSNTALITGSFLKKVKQSTARKSFGFRQFNPLKRKHPTSVDECRLNDSNDNPHDSDISNYNCHACHFSHKSPALLVKHLKIEHYWTDKLPKIEIFPKNDDGEIWALRRCGFCLFESYNPKAFKQHVISHTIWPPTQCLFCSFASFSQSLIVDHVKSVHRAEYKILEREQMCLMLNNGNVIEASHGSNANNPEGTGTGTPAAVNVNTGVSPPTVTDVSNISSGGSNNNNGNVGSDVGNKTNDVDDDGGDDKLSKVNVNRKFLCKELHDEYTMVTDDNEQFKILNWEGDVEPYITLVRLNIKPGGEKVNDDDNDNNNDNNNDDDEGDDNVKENKGNDENYNNYDDDDDGDEAAIADDDENDADYHHIEEEEDEEEEEEEEDDDNDGSGGDKLDDDDDEDDDDVDYAGEPL